MRLELRGLLLDLVPDFAVEEHEGREALFRHGVAAAAFRGCFALSSRVALWRLARPVQGARGLNHLQYD